MSLNFLSSIQNVSFLMSPSLIVPLKKVASRNVPSRNVSKNMDDDRSPSSTTITNHESLTQRGISYLCFFSIMNHESRITNHQLKEYVIHTFFSITNHESLIMNHESWIKARIGALGGHMEQKKKMLPRCAQAQVIGSLNFEAAAQKAYFHNKPLRLGASHSKSRKHPFKKKNQKY